MSRHLSRIVLTMGLVLMVIIVLGDLFEGQGCRSGVFRMNEREWIESSVTKIQIGARVSAPLTVVAMYFKLDTSKHSHAEYLEWQANFFSSSSSAPLVIYTDKSSYEELLGQLFIANTPNAKTLYVFNSLWDITRLIEIDRDQDYIQAYKNHQLRIDSQSHMHTPSLYAIWNAKPYLMRRTSLANIYASEFFVYTDIGAFRYNIYPRWPDTGHLLELSKRLKDRMLFGQVNQSSLVNAARYQGDYIHPNATKNAIQGGFFAGSARALSLYYSNFYAIHDQILRLGQFVGKDQTLMNIYVFAKHPELSCRLWMPSLFSECLPNENRWFVYQLFFSDRNCSESSEQYWPPSSSVTCSQAEPIGIARCLECHHQTYFSRE